MHSRRRAVRAAPWQRSPALIRAPGGRSVGNVFTLGRAESRSATDMIRDVAAESNELLVG
jgi:hypothetical protein